MRKRVIKLYILTTIILCCFDIFSQEVKSVDFFVKAIREQNVDNSLKIDTFSFYENKLVGAKLLNDIGSKYSITIYERIQDIKYSSYYKPTDIFTVYSDSLYFKFKGFIRNEERIDINLKSITVFDYSQNPLFSFVFLADTCKLIVKYTSNDSVIEKQMFIPTNEILISNLNLKSLTIFREQLFRISSTQSIKKEEFLVLLSNDLLW